MTQNSSEDLANITIITLTKALMLENYNRIKKLLDLIPGRKWSKEEIIADRPMKWDYTTNCTHILLCFPERKNYLRIPNHSWNRSSTRR